MIYEFISFFLLHFPFALFSMQTSWYFVCLDYFGFEFIYRGGCWTIRSFNKGCRVAIVREVCEDLRKQQRRLQGPLLSYYCDYNAKWLIWFLRKGERTTVRNKLLQFLHMTLKVALAATAHQMHFSIRCQVWIDKSEMRKWKWYVS